MADNSIVQGLFGVDPLQYQQQQQLLQANQNLQLAQLDPLQARRYSVMQAGTNIGNAGMQMLGIEDPMLKQATTARQLASQFDLSKPQGLDQYSAALQQAGLPQLAMQATAASQKLKESAATIHSKMKENLSTVGKAQNDRLRLLQAGYPPNSPEVQELTRYINSEGQGKAPQISLDVKMLDAAAGRRNTFIAENKPLIEQGTAIEQAKTLLKTDSAFGEAGFENTVVSVFGGDKQKSKSEMARLANTGGFDERITNSLTKFASGKVSELTNDDRMNVLTVLEGDIKRKYNARRSNTVKAASGVKDLQGQEGYMAPTYEEMVGGGAAAGRPAVSVGQTGNSQKYGNYKVLEVDQFGQPTKIEAQKGGVLTLSGAK